MKIYKLHADHQPNLPFRETSPDEPLAGRSAFLFKQAKANLKMGDLTWKNK
jgi:hypothetical protein